MSRQERKNMIEFIQMRKGMLQEAFMYMTDSEIEHIYNTTYYEYEETVE
ncbi:BH0509 family protein [Bacillus sp. HMF5848]|nr:BH0509 family protein [Bacillus sp. HMF5848]RSK26067.1 BH0509 family protein [Bacillus sp. HMF5848]